VALQTKFFVRFGPITAATFLPLDNAAARFIHIPTMRIYLAATIFALLFCFTLTRADERVPQIATNTATAPATAPARPPVSIVVTQPPSSPVAVHAYNSENEKQRPRLLALMIFLLLLAYWHLFLRGKRSISAD
jgi:hypothetical protein